MPERIFLVYFDIRLTEHVVLSLSRSPIRNVYCYATRYFLYKITKARSLCSEITDSSAKKHTHTRSHLVILYVMTRAGLRENSGNRDIENSILYIHLIYLVFYILRFIKMQTYIQIDAFAAYSL